MLKNLRILFSLPPLLCLYWGLYLGYSDNWGSLETSGASLKSGNTLAVMGLNLGFFPIFSLFLARKLGLIHEYNPRHYGRDLVIVYLIIELFLFWTYYVSRHGGLWAASSWFSGFMLASLLANCVSLVLSRMVLLDMRIICLLLGLIYALVHGKNQPDYPHIDYPHIDWVKYLSIPLIAGICGNYLYQQWRAALVLRAGLTLAITAAVWICAELLSAFGL